MKLGKKLPAKYFILSQILILITGLAFLAGLYYVLNIQHQPPSSLFARGPVTTIPKSLKLDLEQPESDILNFTPSIVISGKTNSGNTILISTDTDDEAIKAKPDGSFAAKWTLEEGVNKFTVVSFDSTGDSKSEQRTVYYSKEKI
ncbi:hypothetical protein HYS95_00215 [Candidatus Daviesbacteria bacterium]|nr:hypothetical protein [Candidatus Daviesbacteria bacterium]